jgi:hypothetical protein
MHEPVAARSIAYCAQGECYWWGPNALDGHVRLTQSLAACVLKRAKQLPHDG